MTKSKQHKKMPLRTKRIEKLAQEVGVDSTKLESEINQVPEINASRMVSLYGRLAAGSYRINLKKTSNRLLSLERELDMI